MPLLETLIGPLASIIDKVIPDKDARARAKLELLALEGTQELKQIEARLSAIVAEAQSADPWTSRARPSFLYVMYALILFSVPMGVIAAFDPIAARAIGEIGPHRAVALPRRPHQRPVADQAAQDEGRFLAREQRVERRRVRHRQLPHRGQRRERAVSHRRSGGSCARPVR